MRVELFGDEVESLRWFSTFTQRSLGRRERVEIAPAAELDPEYRELAEMAAERGAERAARRRGGPAGGPLPLLPRAGAGRGDGRGRRRGGAAARARRPLAGRHDQPALRRRAPPLPAARTRSARRSSGRAAVTLLGGVRGPAAPVPRAGRRHRGALDHGGGARAREARALRLRDRGRLGPARRGRARRLQPRAPAPALRRRRRAPIGEGLWFAQARAARGLHRAAAEARRDPGPPPAAPPPRRAPGGHARPRVPGVHRAAPRRHRRAHRPRHRPLHRLRHQDRRRRHARLPRASSTATATASSCPPTSSIKPEPLRRRATARAPALSKLGSKTLGEHEGARQARGARSWPAS